MIGVPVWPLLGRATAGTDHETPFITRSQLKAEARALYVEKCKAGVRVALDCSFYALMNDRERASIGSQIA